MQRHVKVDWLSFTTRRTLPDCLELFRYLEHPLNMQEKGRNGYTFSFASPDGVTVAFTPLREDIHINLTGSACDIGLVKLLCLFEKDDFVTRLDIAMDCVSSGFTCAEIWGYLQRGAFLSVASNIRQYNGLLQEQGHTIYIGSNASERMVRIYDKGAESKKRIDWVRYEIQLRGASATAFSMNLQKHPDKFPFMFLSLLNKQIRITAKPVDKSDHHRADSPLHPMWAKVTNEVNPISLHLPPRAKATTCSIMKHVKNCASSLKTLKTGMCDYNEFIESIIEDAILKDKHINAIDELMLIQSPNPTM